MESTTLSDPASRRVHAIPELVAKIALKVDDPTRLLFTSRTLNAVFSDPLAITRWIEKHTPIGELPLLWAVHWPRTFGDVGMPIQAPWMLKETDVLRRSLENASRLIARFEYQEIRWGLERVGAARRSEDGTACRTRNRTLWYCRTAGD